MRVINRSNRSKHEARSTASRVCVVGAFSSGKFTGEIVCLGVYLPLIPSQQYENTKRATHVRKKWKCFVAQTKSPMRTNVLLREMKQRFEETKTQFILSELGLGMTFADIALSSNNLERSERNRANAQKACDGANHFLEKAWVTMAEDKEIREKMSRLLAQLSKLQLKQIGGKQS